MFFKKKILIYVLFRFIRFGKNQVYDAINTNLKHTDATAYIDEQVWKQRFSVGGLKLVLGRRALLEDKRFVWDILE